MKVMSIALDRNLLTGVQWGDVTWRLVEYGKLVEEYHQVILAHGSLHLKARKLSDNVWVYPTNGKGRYFPTRVWDAYRFAQRICEERHIDVLQTHNPLDTGLVAYLLKRKYRIPMVLGVYGDFVGHPLWLGQSYKHRLLNPLAKWLLHQADLVKVQTPETAENLSRQGIPADRIWTGPVAVNLDKFGRLHAQGVAAVRRAHAPNGEKLVMFAGRLVLTKNVPLLLHAVQIAFSRYPKVKLLICGDGDERASLENLARALGIADQTVFLGAMTHDQLPNYYGACDVFALPSDHEGFGLVLLEAGMAARPVVATSTAGSRLIIQDGATGFLVPPRDVNSFADKLLLLLKDEPLAQRMGSRAREFVSRTFGADFAIQDVVKMWETAVELNRGVGTHLPPLAHKESSL